LPLPPPKMPRLVIIVPTRDRADIAVNAVWSLLASSDSSFEIFLSDNSTLSSHSSQLEHFVKSCDDPRLTLRRPPYAMSMTHHWDWALKEALENPEITHAVFLTDRMMFKSGCLDALLAIVVRHPEQIVSYDHDRVLDHRVPIIVELSPWSDTLLELSSTRLLALAARCVFAPALPRLLNSVVPRAVLEEVHRRNGTFVGSISPDYSFCFRSLGLVEHLVYWDRAPIIHYALNQSNGESAARGVASSASVDFWKHVEESSLTNTPCPGVRTVRNAILHEYGTARAGGDGTRFPAVDLDSYIAMLRSEIEYMENPEVASEMSAVLNTCVACDSFWRQGANKGGAIRRIARKWGVGRLALSVRQWLKPAVAPSPTVHAARPAFAEADEALQFALCSSGERLPATRLAFLGGK